LGKSKLNELLADTSFYSIQVYKIADYRFPLYNSVNQEKVTKDRLYAKERKGGRASGIKKEVTRKPNTKAL
jgi:hypothetical protein